MECRTSMLVFGKDFMKLELKPINGRNINAILNYQTDNVRASAFYKSFGFEETGEEFKGEIVLEQKV